MSRTIVTSATAGPPGLSRRQALRGGLGLAALSALAACESKVASRPGYLLSALGMPADFRAHLRAETAMGPLNIGGVDLHFAEGVPVLAIAPGYVYQIGESVGGGLVTQVDAGLFVYEYAHQDEIFVKPRQQVTRSTIIGTEGKTGRNSGDRSHLHITVAGSAAFHHHRYERFGPDHAEKNISSMMNYVLDPDQLTEGRRPLVESPWAPDADYNGAYDRFVETEIKPRLLAIAADRGVARATAGFVRRRAEIAAQLNQAVNRLWKLRYDRDGAAAANKDFATTLDELFVKVRMAGNLIRLTSPYVMPGDDKALAAVAEANPEHAGLLREFYRTTKLAGRFPRAV